MKYDELFKIAKDAGLVTKKIPTAELKALLETNNLLPTETTETTETNDADAPGTATEDSTEGSTEDSKESNDSFDIDLSKLNEKVEAEVEAEPVMIKVMKQVEGNAYFEREGKFVVVKKHGTIDVKESYYKKHMNPREWIKVS